MIFSVSHPLTDCIRIEDILDILNLQNGIKKTGFSPSESTDDMMCKEFYKCKKNANANNSNEDFDEDEL